MSDLCEQTVQGQTGKRRTRNESEKKRRDAFNRLIEEMTVLVADGDRKMDKSNVLKAAINFLKQRQVRAESTTEEVRCVVDPRLSRATQCSARDIVHVYADALNAGSFCMGCTGHIHHVSSTFASLFNTHANEMRDTNLLEALDKDSVKHLEQTLSSEVFRAASASTSDACTLPESPLIHLNLVTRSSGRRLLMLGRLQKASVGPSPPTSLSEHSPTQAAQPANGDEETQRPIESASHTALCLVGIARPLDSSEPEISFDTLNSLPRRNNSFVIVYNARFTCIHIDNSSSLILGYSRLDMIGTSGYEYVHTDDLNSLADAHRTLMQRGVHSIEEHRLRTKSGQWLWVKCTANIRNEGLVTRVTCAYTATNPPEVPPSTPQPSRSRNPLHSSTPTQQSPRPPGDGLLPLTTMQTSPYPVGALSVSTTLCPIGVEGSCPTTGSVPSCPLTGDSLSTGVPNDQSTPLTSPTDLPRKAESLNSNSPLKHGAAVGLPVQDHDGERLKRKLLNSTVKDSPSRMDSECVSSNCVEVPPCESASSPKKRVHPVAYIEHFPLPSNPPSTVHMDTAPIACANPQTATKTDSTLAIPPVYRQVWEELQRKSDALRQQVIQKELELQELHIKQFLSSLRGNKTI